MSLEAEGRHENPMGTLHGGILCDLVDGLRECDVEDVDGRLIARASSTCMALRGDSAQGR